MIARTQLTNDYSISKIIKGGWQLAGGHGAIDRATAIDDMFAFYDAGITTFDCADIYTGVEELIGDFLKKLRIERGVAAAETIQVHTKYVPDRQDLAHLSQVDVEKAIRRSLARLGVERLDLVQFHWWDFSIPRYVEVAKMLQGLKQKGLIRHIGLTNFDPAHIEELAQAGVDILTDQIQYSALDRRPEKRLRSYCATTGMTMLCYGGLAGGFLADRYLDVAEPTVAELQCNRSLIKYKLVIDDAGGWSAFQALLRQLSDIGRPKGLSVSEVALLYTLNKPYVSAVIVGARNHNHIDSLKRVARHKLTQLEMAAIDRVLSRKMLLTGDIYELERTSEKHAGIMKYNLNKDER